MPIPLLIPAVLALAGVLEPFYPLPRAAANTKVVDQILVRENQFENRILNKDLPRLRSLLAPGFTAADETGKARDKTRFLADIDITSASPEFLSVNDRKVRVHGDTAIVTSRVMRISYSSGKDFTEVFYATNVWRRRGGQWLCQSARIGRVATKR